MVIVNCRNFTRQTSGASTIEICFEQLKDRAADAEKESDYLQFQFNQLESARLQLGEKEALEEELELLISCRKYQIGLKWVILESAGYRAVCHSSIERKPQCHLRTRECF